MRFLLELVVIALFDEDFREFSPFAFVLRACPGDCFGVIFDTVKFSHQALVIFFKGDLRVEVEIWRFFIIVLGRHLEDLFSAEIGVFLAYCLLTVYF